MNSYKTIATCLALALSQTVAAGPIDVAQARTNVLKQVAQQKSNVSAGKRYAPAKEADFKHVYTEKTQTGTPAVYVFNSPQGFVLAAADDAVPSLLGYSDSGDFDPNNIPDGLQYLMSEYAREIATLPNYASQLPVPDYKIEHTKPVGPLLETKWDQLDPFNRLCPFALSVGTNFAATGCMTTALAQIMRFHKWPKQQGNGSYEMDAKVGPKTTHYERNYYNTTYNWDVMPIHKNDFTEEGASEVSKLMIDVAVALNTTFNNVSGSTHISVVPMFLTYFDYDPGIEVLSKNKMTAEQFNHIVISDLQAGRPVYLEGGETAGHAFVCDGYNGEGLFHINWGWSGTSDGYYCITGLSPKEAGTGGEANAGYSNGLRMIHNIKPYQGGKLARPEARASYTRHADTGISVEKTETGCYFRANLSVFPMVPHNRNIRAKFGLLVELPNGTKITKWDNNEKPTQIIRTNGYKGFRVELDPAWLVDGTKVHYIYHEIGEPNPEYVRNTRGDFSNFTIKQNDKGEWLALSENLAFLLKEAATPANTVDITYNIHLNGKFLGSKVVKDVPGQEPNKSFIPSYYVQANGFPKTVPNAPETYDIQTSYIESAMPFVTDTKAYNLSFSIGGNVYMWYASNAIACEKKNPDQAEARNRNAQWRFSGNWFEGFTIQCLNANEYLTTPSYDDTEGRLFANASSYPNQQRFLLLHRDEGFYFKSKNFSYCIAHTQPADKNEVYLFGQEYYGGNIVNITEAGNIPSAEGVNYNVQLMGYPEGKSPQLNFGDASYGQGEHFHAVDLDKSTLSATRIDCFDSEILVGEETVYVKYTPGPIDYITYTVQIAGNYPPDADPMLTYRSKSYKTGDELTATGLTLMELSATQYENYACEIDVKSSTIVVTYKPINYKTYTVNFTGLPEGRNPKLFYNSSAVKESTFTAGDLTIDQLSATYYPDYGRNITLNDQNNTITVAYYGSEFYFDFTRGYNNQFNTIEKFPLKVKYKGYDGENNIYRTVDYTEVTSSEAPIKSLTFVTFREFDGVTSTTGKLDVTTGQWTSTNDTRTVRFNGGDGYAKGMRVYLSIPECKHNVVDDVCLLCGHGFINYAANNKVTPHSENALLGESGSPLTIVSNTFEDGLGTIELSAPLVAIGDDAFAGCTDLTGTLRFNRSLKSIGNRAFSGCSGLGMIRLSSVPAVSSSAFDGIDGEVLIDLDDQSYVCTTSTPNFPSRTSATYSRQMANQWATVVIPFNVAARGENYELYELTRWENDNLMLTKKQGIVAAGTPAIVCMNESAINANKYTLILDAANSNVSTSCHSAAATAEGLTLKGSYQMQEITNENGFIISKNKFWNIQQSKGTNKVYNAPFRSYISADSPTLVRELSISLDTDEGTTTGVDALNSLFDGQAQYFDASGRAISRLQPGVNIIKQSNGKTTKIIIK